MVFYPLWCRSFPVLHPVIFFYLPPCKFFVLIYPLIGHSKTDISGKKIKKLVFEWPIMGVNQNNFFLQGVNKKIILQGVKLEMTYITGVKHY